jgi:hypothetical protein
MKNNNSYLTENESSELDQMIRRIAFKKKNTIMMDPEDVISELWINSLMVIEKKRYADPEWKLDYNYVAAACFKKIVDLVRQNIRKSSVPIDVSLLDREDNSEKAEADSHVYDLVGSQHIDSVEESAEVRDMLSLFEENSKEYKLVKSWMEILGITEANDLSKLPESAFDGYIATVVLGYAGSKSSGYAKIRQKVRNTLVKNGYKV